jgi:hypothetical protein
MKKRTPFRTALSDKNLLGRSMPGPDWFKWRTLMTGVMGEALTVNERQIWTELTGREHEPLEMAEEFIAVIGRRGGKTEATATGGAYIASCCDFTDVLVPGETGILLIVAADVEQATIALDRIEAKLRTSPVLRQLVKSRTAKQLRLTNNIVIQVRASNFRRVRGATLIAAIGDESAFWSVEGSANPDTEICAALRPALATTGGPLFLISSPYAKRGELYSLYKRHFGPNGDPRIVVAQAPTRVMNESLSQSVVDRAMQRDPAAARAEYGAEFRDDVGQFIDRDIILACTMSGVRELPPAATVTYKAGVDPSGGSSDSFTVCVGHLDSQRDTCVVDAIREIIAPFSPEAAVAELSQLLKSYRVTRVTGDRYGGEWPREAFSRHGITYELSAMPKSGLYGCLLPLLNSGRIELLDNGRLISQLANLERKTARGGRDSIDHPIGQHDDVSNVVALLAAITISNSGGYSQEVWRRAFGDPADDALPVPHRFGAPTSGKHQSGAVDLGHGGYHCPSAYEQECARLGQEPWTLKSAFEAAARERQIQAHPTRQQVREVFAKAERDGLVPNKNGV